MGDNILCNAIVRTFAEQYDRVYVFAKSPYIENQVFMYRDNSKIRVMALKDDKEVKGFIRMFPNNNYRIIGVRSEWFYNFDVLKLYETFDHGFYVDAGVPFEDKWNKFYIQRDLEKEKNTFYNLLGLKDDEEFLFVHDDPERNRHFKKEFITKGIKTIHPAKYKNIGLFDFIYTIEKAKEVHVMNSSFSCLIDTMQIKTGKLFFHQYARTDMGDNPNHKLKLNWTILK